MAMGGIYKITCIKNKSFYIGSAKNIIFRFNKHKSCLRKNCHINKNLQNSWNKYGEESFMFETIEEVKILENLIEREQHYIDTLKPTFNIRLVAHSNLGLKMSDETKKKMRESRKKYFKNNPGVIETLRKRMIDNPIKPWLDKKSPNSGKKTPNGVKKKISFAKTTKDILQFDKEGNLVKEWETMSAIVNAGFNNGNVLRCCKGIRKTHKNYIWKFKNK